LADVLIERRGDVTWLTLNMIEGAGAFMEKRKADFRRPWRDSG
jgi:hypothetical protein